MNPIVYFFFGMATYSIIMFLIIQWDIFDKIHKKTARVTIILHKDDVYSDTEPKLSEKEKASILEIADDAVPVGEYKNGVFGTAYVLRFFFINDFVTKLIKLAEKGELCKHSEKWLTNKERKKLLVEIL